LTESTLTKTEFLRASGDREVIVNTIRANVLDAIGDSSFDEGALQVGL
jgi:hypothetical protein